MQSTIAAVSYGSASIAFALLTVSLAISWHGKFRGALLGLACLFSAVWAGILAAGSLSGSGLAALSEIFEVLRSLVWFLFLGSVLGAAQGPSGASKLNSVAGVALAYGLALLVATLGQSWSGSSPGFGSSFGTDIVGRVVLAVAGMVLVEQLFRNTHPEQRWGIKFLCLSVGGMFAFDFFLYADAMLFRRVDEELWAARGFINALVAPLVMVSAARNPSWSLTVHVSRRIVFHTAALLGAGIYLLIMAAAGYFIRTFGGTWGSVVQTAFLFGAVVLLLVVLFSGTMRAQLKVFLNKHFFSYKFDYREEWLRLTQTLSSADARTALGEATVKALAGFVESPAGALWQRSESGAFACVARWNLPAVEGSEPQGSPFVSFLEERQWVIDLDESDHQPELYAGLDMPQWLLAVPRAWLVVPLMLGDRLQGFVLLTRSRGRVRLNWEVSDLLRTAGRQAASYLAQAQAAEALVIARQFESFNRMSAFVVHDLKNLVAQLSLMLANAEHHKHNPEFQDDMLSTVENSVEKMNRLLTQLRTGGGSEQADSEIDLPALLRQVIEDKNSMKPQPAFHGRVGAVVLANRERLRRVIGHIVQNASEATRYDGRVDVRLALRDGYAMIQVEDTGKGMDEQFIRERLFRPFDSTKGSGMGIGAHECQEYVRELGGRLDVHSTVGKGTIFEIYLPLRRDGTMAEVTGGAGGD